MHRLIIYMVLLLIYRWKGEHIPNNFVFWFWYSHERSIMQWIIFYDIYMGIKLPRVILIKKYVCLYNTTVNGHWHLGYKILKTQLEDTKPLSENSCEIHYFIHAVVNSYSICRTKIEHRLIYVFVLDVLSFLLFHYS